MCTNLTVLLFDHLVNDEGLAVEASGVAVAEDDHVSNLYVLDGGAAIHCGHELRLVLQLGEGTQHGPAGTTRGNRAVRTFDRLHRVEVGIGHSLEELELNAYSAADDEWFLLGHMCQIVVGLLQPSQPLERADSGLGTKYP